MAFVERGAGAPLLLVHGTLCDYRHWAAQMEPFGARYRTIAVSLRHCWPEKWDGEGDDFTVQQHTADIAGFIGGLQGGAGSSASVIPGEGTSPSVWRRIIPDLIRTLILVEPGGVLAADLETGLAPGSADDCARAPLRRERPSGFDGARSTRASGPRST